MIITAQVRSSSKTTVQWGNPSFTHARATECQALWKSWALTLCGQKGDTVLNKYVYTRSLVPAEKLGQLTKASQPAKWQSWDLNPKYLLTEFMRSTVLTVEGGETQLGNDSGTVIT